MFISMAITVVENEIIYYINLICLSMKKFMISLAIASIAMFSYAQETVSEVVVPTKSHSVVTNDFGSNWFVSANAGINFYNGTTERGEIFDHMSPALNIYVGKWHTPGFGWRVAYHGLNIQTLEKLDHAMFMNFHFDAMFNLSNLIWGYRENRIWNVTPYIGVGWAGRHGFNTDNENSMNDNEFAGTLSANIGIISSWNISERWAINAELSNFIFRNGFSSKPAASGHDYMHSLTVGVTYKFGKTNWEKAVDVPALQAIYGGIIDGLENDLNNANLLNKKAQNEIANLKDQLSHANKAVEEAAAKFVDVKQSVFFAFASSKIDSKKEELNIKAYAKAAADAGVKLRVVGFADTIGSEAYNQTLSLNRAEAVAEMLRANGAEVETVIGQGESSEYSTKFLNRRVIIEVAQ